MNWKQYILPALMFLIVGFIVYSTCRRKKTQSTDTAASLNMGGGVNQAHIGPTAGRDIYQTSRN